MKKIICTLALSLFLFSCTSQAPKQFTEDALNDTFINLEDESVTFKSILETYKGQTIVIDIWASWCGDCIKSLPLVKELQKTYTNAAYVFLSLDRGKAAWKRGIKKYEVKGDHYFMPSGKKSPFANFVNISWIPRYMVVNKSGEIVVFNVIEANNDKLIEALKK